MDHVSFSIEVLFASHMRATRWFSGWLRGTTDRCPSRNDTLPTNRLFVVGGSSETPHGLPRACTPVQAIHTYIHTCLHTYIHTLPVCTDKVLGGRTRAPPAPHPPPHFLSASGFPMNRLVNRSPRLRGRIRAGAHQVATTRCITSDLFFFKFK